MKSRWVLLHLYLISLSILITYLLDHLWILKGELSYMLLTSGVKGLRIDFLWITKDWEVFFYVKIKLLLSPKRTVQTWLEPFVVKMFFLLSCLTAAGSAMVVSAMKCGFFGELEGEQKFRDCGQTSMEGVQLLIVSGWFLLNIELSLFSLQSSVHTLVDPLPFLICKLCELTNPLNFPVLASHRAWT